ncbi:MAG: YraN family protein [Myxococcota bacterium]
MHSICMVQEHTTDKGRRYEALAERVLARRGYSFVARNVRYGGVEIDRVAWHRDVLCFIEVRARHSAAFCHPVETVDHRKRRRLVRGAHAYLHRHFDGPMPMVRFDVVTVVFGPSLPEVRVYEAAFDGSDW